MHASFAMHILPFHLLLLDKFVELIARLNLSKVDLAKMAVADQLVDFNQVLWNVPAVYAEVKSRL